MTKLVFHHDTWNCTRIDMRAFNNFRINYLKDNLTQTDVTIISPHMVTDSFKIIQVNDVTNFIIWFKKTIISHYVQC